MKLSSRFELNLLWLVEPNFMGPHLVAPMLLLAKF